MRGTIEERFFAKVVVGDCWHWVGARNSGGYGQFWLNGRMPVAHRVSYEMLVGPVPSGMELDHLCKNRSCVNPDHLEPVTPRDNKMRGAGPAAANVRKVACLRGHELAGDNLRTHPQGRRVCKECDRGHQAAYRLRQLSA